MSENLLSYRRRRRRRRRSCSRVDCQWRSWGLWTRCSKSCGFGRQSRQRSVKVNPSCGGTLCNTGDAFQTRACNIRCCPVNCQWHSWGQWTRCSKSCGLGRQTRQRSVKVTPSCGGTPCSSGDAFQTRACHNRCCPVNCVWGPWINKPCSETCGYAYRLRTRSLVQGSECGGHCVGSDRECTPCIN